MQRVGTADKRRPAMDERRFQQAHASSWSLYLVFALLPIYWMVNMSFKTNEEILSSFSLLAAALHAGTTTGPSSPTRPGTRATSTR